MLPAAVIAGSFALILVFLLVFLGAAAWTAVTARRTSPLAEELDRFLEETLATRR